MIQTQRNVEEIVRRGEEIYEQQIRPKVETEENVGKIISIDIDSGDYEIDPLASPTGERLKARHPDAQLYGLRIGYDVAYAVGGLMRRVHK